MEYINKPFVIEEVKCELGKLKQNKTPGRDSLRSKMLKNSNYNLLNELKKLFNFVIDSGYCPENWE